MQCCNQKYQINVLHNADSRLLLARVNSFLSVDGGREGTRSLMGYTSQQHALSIIFCMPLPPPIKLMKMYFFFRRVKRVKCVNFRVTSAQHTTSEFRLLQICTRLPRALQGHLMNLASGLVLHNSVTLLILYSSLFVQISTPLPAMLPTCQYNSLFRKSELSEQAFIHHNLSVPSRVGPARCPACVGIWGKYNGRSGACICSQRSVSPPEILL